MPADRRIFAIIAVVTFLVACKGPKESERTPPSDTALASSDARMDPQPSKGGADRSARWVLQPSNDGTALTLFGADNTPIIRLVCPAGKNQLLVNVPGFSPIGSEERLSFGGNGNATTLVADINGDAERGGVSGVGEVPNNLEDLVGRRLSASYGVQKTEPHSAPPTQLSSTFAAACRKGLAANAPTEKLAATGSACLMQAGEPLRMIPRRAVGTEPFWSARTEGRCVIYSHPDNQDGTRIWTRYSKGSGAETWAGSLGQKRFELRIREQANCSDGMSDKRYPLAVELMVLGEIRQGCAEPA